MRRQSFFLENGTFFHHAYLLSGEGNEVKANIQTLLKKEKKVEWENNPDVLHFDFPTLGIDESRAIQSAQMKMPVKGEHTFLFISFQTATFEAQNSLLKVFEDPTSHTIFFVITPNAHTLLPTLLSRLSVVVMEEGVEKEPQNAQSKKFVTSDKSERLSFVKDIIERKDKKEVLTFLSDIEAILHTKWNNQKYSQELSNVLKEIIRAREYIDDRASSVKLILEHISLVIPQLK